MKIPTYKETWFDPEIEWVQKDDIETLLNPWKDAEKEKPEEIGRQYFVKVKMKNSGTIHCEVSNFYSAGWGTELRLKNDRKVIAWMNIPKNEGEE